MAGVARRTWSGISPAGLGYYGWTLSALRCDVAMERASKVVDTIGSAAVLLYGQSVAQLEGGHQGPHETGAAHDKVQAKAGGQRCRSVAYK